MDNALRNKFLFIELRIFELSFQRLYEISPDKRLCHYLIALSYRYFGKVYDVEMFIEKSLALFTRLIAVVKNVERVKVGVLRINAVARKASAQTV